METLIRVENLKKWFPVRLGLLTSLFTRKSLYVKAVDDISFKINVGEIFGLAGESGSGKTTTGRLLLKLIEPTDGKIFYREKDITRMSQREFKPLRRKFQIIFQDPYESLNPRMTIESILSEPLIIQGERSKDIIDEKIYKALEDVRLVPPEEFIFRYPHELSGGQRQRVAIARALILNPEFMVADEPVSMLDVSIRAEILNLMLELRRKYNMAILYITHDLSIVKHMCERLAIMYLGKIMEMGEAQEIINKPLHPYTQALVEAVPVPDPTSKRVEVVIKGEIPSPINPPPGCRFSTRCPNIKGEICRQKIPPIVEVENGHYVACHLYS